VVKATSRWAAGAFCIASLAALQPLYGNLIINPNFSAGNSGFASTYTLSSSLVPENTYTVGSNPINHHAGGSSFGDHTTGTGLMLIVNGNTTPELTVWQQTVNVSTGTSYSLSAWAASWGNDGTQHDPSPAILQFTINGEIVGVLGPAAADGVWTKLSTTWTSGPATTAIIRIVDLNTAQVGNDFAVDDLHFAVVPEPLTGAPLWLAATSLILRRRP
jgi:hypothetical protein